VGAFLKELLQVGIYKRSQGRIARQATFAALVVAVALGLWRMNVILQAYDPSVPLSPAVATCTSKTGRVGADATMILTGPGAGESTQEKKETKENAGVPVTITLRSGDEFAKVAEAINAQSEKTGVKARVPDEREEKGEKSGPYLQIATVKSGAAQFLKIDVPENALQVAGLTDGKIARGRNELNLSLQYVVPGVLFLLTLWVSYRVVNVPAFADFLIAVEAEMNKVSWPTWHELSRASMVVLILVFALAAVLFAFDTVWALIFKQLGIGI